ncbi:MAG: hypothetical protein H7Z15_01425 [Rhizobacter sp.]|nr:hypothetical protein [Rhizobacter sp.]
MSRSNSPLAVATFFIGFPAALFTFFRHRSDPHTSVTRAFIANVILWAAFLLCVWLILLPLLDAQAAEFEKSIAVATPATQAASAPVAAVSVAQVVPVAPPASAASAVALPIDPIDSFADALRAAGLNATLTRMPATTALPAGVIDAALFSVASPGAASAPAGTEVSATLFKCDAPAACRDLAAVYIQQGAEGKKRVLQNGLLLLAMPAVGTDGDLTPAAVASVFRKL